MRGSRPLIELKGLCKHYGGKDGRPRVDVLQAIDLSIHAGEFVAIVGASGSGKSTLMHLIGCLDRPDGGRYLFNGQDVADFSADQLAWLRRVAFGFVFQGYHLIATETASENVQMPAIYAGMCESDLIARAQALLERLGLGGKPDSRPNQLSGGQQQRVSIARALMNGGSIILADEPTGALDSNSGAQVMTLLRELAQSGHTIILITHDRSVAEQAGRVIEIHDGRIIADSAVMAAARQSKPHPAVGSNLETPAGEADAGLQAALGKPDEDKEFASFPAELREAARTAWRHAHEWRAHGVDSAGHRHWRGIRHRHAGSGRGRTLSCNAANG